ncbi:dethiobiotin synthase [Paraclostridium bifermentans]|uniref:ATP-dependent dethiobiotin synthetase BioD n=1 Tax=Paraclostridium bifermentans TaxID=1490 RepID=A0AA44DJT2_PARBF|nr:dethiobiotin synthase [Paraclostridium bifermentans]MBN8046878.1 dethiobiotin synthase [Paraclostridium bifermentans]NME09050.1 dethiobiotin synthase [Paraclostridium bifermentans]
MNSKGIFITGTDTDVGKTYISAMIMKSLVKSNINATYFKAALSGADEIDNKLIPGDAKYVCDISGIDPNYDEMVSYTFKTAVSPHLASVIEDKEIKLEKIKYDFENLSNKYEFILAEGSGGIVCPIKIDDNECILLEDIIKLLGFEVLVVARSSVGTINHTVLTVKYLEEKNIKIRGIILNEYDKNNIVHADNAKVIEKLTNINIVAFIPKYQNESDDINIDLEKILE